MNSATLFRNSALYSAYNAVWATAAIFVPLVAMIICNWCLVKALRRSSAMQRRCCRIASNASTRVTLADNDGIDSIRNRSDSLFVGPNTLRTPTTAGHRITPTLVALIVLFIVLVGPSEILTFVMTQQVTSYITNFLNNLYDYNGSISSDPKSVGLINSRVADCRRL